MKTLLSMALAGVFAVQGACAQTNGWTYVGTTDQDPPTSAKLPADGAAKDGGLACAVVLIAALVSGCMVIWLYVHGERCCGNKRLILQRNCHDGSEWQSVLTNDVAEPTAMVTNKWQVFRQIIADPQWEYCKFRVLVMDIPTE